MFNRIVTYDELTSTNDFLKQQLNNLSDLSVVRTRYQTHGRGQFDRVWISEPNTNLLFSILYRNVKSNEMLKILEEKLLSCLLAFLQRHGLAVTHKPPNDLYLNGKKIGGLLIETRRIGMDFDYVIVGIGLNVNQKKFPASLNATSIALAIGWSLNVDELFNELIKDLALASQ